MGRKLHWLNERLPVIRFWRRHFTHCYVPKNLNFWYFFGVLALLLLLIEMVSGFSLSIHYVPDAGLNAAGVPRAFASLDFLARAGIWGELLRRVHVLGASLFFLAIYLHVFRALMYGAYCKPRELVWLSGVILFLLCLALAFFGRLLAWSTEGYWGTTVILNLLSAIPLLGSDLAHCLRGGGSVGTATLGRFYMLHAMFLPLVLLILVALHVVSVRAVGSGNPDGIDMAQNCSTAGVPLDALPYHPYFTVRDLLAGVSCLFLFALLLFFAPAKLSDFLGFGSQLVANPLVTPEHVRPAWYFAPFFAILRAVSWNFLGVEARIWGGLVLASSLFIPAFLPWLDRSPVGSYRYRGLLSRVLLALFVGVVLLLGVLGSLPNSRPVEMLAGFGTVYYFLFFLLMPVWTRLDRCRPPPPRLIMK